MLALLATWPPPQVWVPVTRSQVGLLGLLGMGANLLLFCLLKAFSLVDASALGPPPLDAGDGRVAIDHSSLQITFYMRNNVVVAQLHKGTFLIFRTVKVCEC